MEKTPLQKWILISEIINLLLIVLFSFILIITEINLIVNSEASSNINFPIENVGYIILIILLSIVLTLSFANSIIILASDWKDKKLNDSKILLGILALFFGSIPAIIVGAQKPLKKELSPGEELSPETQIINPEV